ncbi:NAD binding domain of 6-phosphogluconate dehydrogenase-domain-containing protein [Podospora australis]|uniref:3-hydroxyisobutyrate dehydrogenase n=1 Tax=Podospora australis TaxID=1536484 RepID=A0AAN6WPE4_9PEZI|nr:NAD binding domain of 6-phosphogluconate dehydrogenase-domain-containing protein [Podospora australis]
MSSDNSTIPLSVGFVGLGAMGRPMVANLARKLPAGSRIYVHDVVPTVVEELCTEFAGIVDKSDSAMNVAQLSEIVITMLPEGSHVKLVHLDPESGIIAAKFADDKVIIDCSTIDTTTSLSVKAALTAASPLLSFYDAPVSGGVLGAINATMAFFLGCSHNDPNLHRLTAFLSLMGGKVIPCGGPSLGLAAKLSNNYLSGIITVACAEAMDMGMRAGINARTLASVFAAGTAQNTICDVFNPVPGVCPKAPSSNGYKNGFRVQLMRKDIGLAVDMARTVGAKNVLGISGLGVYAAASEASDCQDLDSRVVYRYLGGREDWEQEVD